jgi:hypothetical protein
MTKSPCVGDAMKTFAAVVVALVGLPLAAGATSYPINPGYWEVTTNWLGLITSTDRYCVAPGNITKFIAAPCNHIYRCDYPVQRIGDGKAYFEGVITGRDELYNVRGGGTYTRTSVDMEVAGSGHWHIVPVADARATMTAHFLAAACPADARRFK